MVERVKKRLYEILEVLPEGDLSSKVFNISIMVLIFLNVVSVILETVESIYSRYMTVLWVFEIFSVLVFTAEYLLRLWVCTVDNKFKGFIKGRIQYALTPLAIVDLMAILPFYLPMIIPFDLRFIRALRLFRIFRLFKMWRYSNSLKTLGNVLKEKKEDLIITLFSALILLVVASSLMYFFESKAQPDAFPNIPTAMWWAVVTLLPQWKNSWGRL